MYRTGLVDFDGSRNYKKDEILSCISQEEIFEYYLGVKVQFLKLFKSPLRSDDHAGCGFYRNDFGIVRYFDKSRNINEDCFGIFNHMPELRNLGFQQRLNKIAKDLSLKESNIIHPPRIIEKELTEIKFLPRNWNIFDLKYWKERGIFIDVNTENEIYPVEQYKVNGITQYQYKPSDPCYAYYFKEDGTKKLYFPFRRKGDKRFITNSNVIQGLDSLPPEGEILVITKSYKDVRTLRTFNIPSIAPQSESVLISKESFTDLYNRFDNIVTLFDYDIAGIRCARMYRKEYSLEPLFITDGTKDISGYYYKNRFKKTQDLINYTIQYYDL